MNIVNYPDSKEGPDSRISQSLPLKIGLIVNTRGLQGWQDTIIREITRVADGTVTHIIEIEPSGKKEAGLTARIWKAFDQIENRLSSRIFHRQFLRRGDDCDGLHDPRAHALEPTLIRTRAEYDDDNGFDLPSLDLASGNEAAPDVILNLTNSTADHALARLAKHGVYSFRFDENRRKRDGLPGFWEFYDNDPTISARIVRTRLINQTGANLIGEHTVNRCSYRTFRLSWNENRRRMLWKAAWLMVDAIRDLRQGLVDTTARTDLDTTLLNLESGPGYKHPNLGQMVLAPFKSMSRLANSIYKELAFDHKWRLLVSTKQGGENAVRNFTHLAGSKDSFWADPFPVEWQGKRCIFFEEYPYATRKGIISCLELPDDIDQSVGPRQLDHRVVLDLDCHLSYPFLFEHAGQLYMIPETSGHNRIELWEPVDFPWKWRKKKTLMDDVSAVDTTLVERDGLWWMFTNIDRRDANDHNYELHLFFTDDPINGEWTAHARNPVATDVRQARMAGSFHVTSDGRLIRKCQMNGAVYGYEIRLCEVTELTRDTYAETLVSEITPHWDNRVERTHHIASWDDITVLDAYYSVPKWKRFA